MKRSEKVALLTKLLKGEVNGSIFKQLYKPHLKPLIIIFKRHAHPLRPNDEVIVRAGPEDVTVLYKDLDAYARSVGGIVVAMLPDNGRDRV
ncbi:hypothetical protein A6C57_18635 [Fibrella sp. ES10-3-2-2]|nr:hypothetical protein A6C57_18635 [Fibrella sp. ES10-3-2-2]